MIPALGKLMERIVLTFPSHPSTLIAVAVENRSAGPTPRRDLNRSLSHIAHDALTSSLFAFIYCHFHCFALSLCNNKPRKEFGEQRLAREQKREEDGRAGTTYCKYTIHDVTVLKALSWRTVYLMDSGIVCCWIY
ncbi:hypothetical protein LOK49_LG09G00832 [Camellia lanceoleosa]|uniref:Uncharacterized protein n=1 Tax=Camellia lanceoleosa TaxID=1840588 RepID=A0ACC0GFV6_9ERIC|nr:hypothetical protein LOK49_LG09G00832 [Camellia lanceoleosa]